MIEIWLILHLNYWTVGLNRVFEVSLCVDVFFELLFGFTEIRECMSGEIFSIGNQVQRCALGIENSLKAWEIYAF